jgi:hypothetical protein
MENLRTNEWTEMNQSYGTLKSLFNHFEVRCQDAESATGTVAPEMPRSECSEAEHRFIVYRATRGAQISVHSIV